MVMALQKKLSAYHKYSGMISMGVLLLLLVGIGSVVNVAQQQTSVRSNAAAPKQLPTGAHFNLNIIGVPKTKSVSMTGNNGGRIFVPLEGSCQIGLAQGTFGVLDANCTDGSARFQLPNPDPTNSGTTTYSVWARALGKPGGSSKTTTCATDPLDGQLYCSVYSMVSTRTKGKSTFSNVTRDLLYVYADIDGDGNTDRMPLFDSRLENYYWQYENSGLKVVQLRFYAVPTTVN